MLRIIAVLVLLPCAVAAQSVLFTDDFNDGNADGWTEATTGAVYEVVDSCYCITAGTGVQHGSSFNVDEISGMSTADYSVYLQVNTHSPTHGALIYVRADPVQETGYFLYLRVYQNRVRICRQDPVGWVNLVTEEEYVFQYDQPYWARFMVVGSSFFGKVWQGDLADETDEWLISAEDTTYTAPGYFGLGAVNVSAQTGIDAQFDDVMVTDQYEAFQAHTWAGIKASFIF